MVIYTCGVNYKGRLQMEIQFTRTYWSKRGGRKGGRRQEL
jgi:uncharacterized protein YfaQ (DUF2300 family)